MRTNLKQPNCFALMLTFCTFGFAPQAKTELENLERDAQDFLAQLNKNDENQSESPLQGIPAAINEIAKQISVRIEGEDSNSSGGDIARSNDLSS